MGFKDKIITIPETSCYWWIGAINDGYGVLRIKDKPIRAHRYAYFLEHGEIPNGLHVLHKCDNRLCVNVEHLYLGTNDQNIADRVARNRSARGEGHARAKLTAEDVKFIRSSRESNTALSKKYGVAVSTIWFARNGKTWKSVTGDRDESNTNSNDAG